MTRHALFASLTRPLLIPLVLSLLGPGASAQRERQGHSLGSVSVQGNLIVVTLKPGALGTENFFNLDQRTLRFTPSAGGYTVQNLPLQWDADYGDQATAAQVALHNFAFPFSGRDWNEFSVGSNGSISFGAPAGRRGAAGGRGSGRGPATFAGRGGGRGGVVLQRYDLLQTADQTLVNTQTAICVLLRVRWGPGKHYVKELGDRAVITWDVSEPYAGIQDWSWYPTVNRFQAVLHKDGMIEMSYNHISVKDAIVGLYPEVNAGEESPLTTLAATAPASAPANLALKDVKLSSRDGVYLQATFETSGPIPPAGDAGLAGSGYHLYLRGRGATEETEWSVTGSAGRGFGGGGRGGAPAYRYLASGPGVAPAVETTDHSLTLRGLLPAGITAGSTIEVRATTTSAGANGGAASVAAQLPAHTVKLTGVASPQVDFAAMTQPSGPYPVVFESFHYLRPTTPEDLACTVIPVLGDHYDDLAYYSDFRVDNPEAGTPSNGPRGGGPEGGAVTGLGGNDSTQTRLDNYCTKGRFQWGFVEPVDADANQMSARPPADVMDANIHNIMAYATQIGEISPDGQMPTYQYAMSQIGHEMEHRWSAFARAKVGDKIIQLGPTHWARGLQAIVPYPYERPSEASAMGGGVWQDNFDGTYTQLDDDYYVPPTGYSYLDLYLMGLISPAEVPDFFLLTNMVPEGRDANGHPIFKADRTKITIQDVIAAEGPRSPDVAHSQRQFNTGMVVIVESGKKPTPGLVADVNAIRLKWMQYFDRVTGGRATMTANPR